jgi:hypothetical protein
MDSMLISVWFMSMVALLSLSSIIPGAYGCAVLILCIPFIVLAIHVLSHLPRDFWFAVGLMCLFIYKSLV